MKSNFPLSVWTFDSRYILRNNLRLSSPYFLSKETLLRPLNLYMTQIY